MTDYTTPIAMNNPVFSQIQSYLDAATIVAINQSPFLVKEINELNAVGVYIVFDNQDGASTGPFGGSSSTVIRMNTSSYAPIPNPPIQGSNVSPAASTPVTNLMFLTTLAHEGIHALEYRSNSLHDSDSATLASATAHASTLVGAAEWVKVNAESEGLAATAQAIVYSQLTGSLGIMAWGPAVTAAINTVLPNIKSANPSNPTDYYSYLDPANLRNATPLDTGMPITGYMGSVDYEDYVANQFGLEHTSISGTNMGNTISYRAYWAQSLGGTPESTPANPGLLSNGSLAGSKYIPVLGTYDGKSQVTQLKISATMNKTVVAAVLTDLVTYLPVVQSGSTKTLQTPFFVKDSATAALNNPSLPLTYYPPGTNIPDPSSGSGEDSAGTPIGQTLIDNESQLTNDQASYTVSEYADGGSDIAESFNSNGKASGQFTENLYVGTTGDLLGGNDVFKIGDVKIAFNTEQVISVDVDASGNTTISLSGQTSGTPETLYISANPNDDAVFTDSAGSVSISSEYLPYAASLSGYDTSSDSSVSDVGTINGGGFVYSSQVGFGVVDLETAVAIQDIFDPSATTGNDQAVAEAWRSDDLANQNALVVADASNSGTSGSGSGGGGGTSPAAPLNANQIDGSAGGTIYDVAGTNQINMGSANATVYATLGNDYVEASSGNISVIATGNTNGIEIDGGSGNIDFTPGSGDNVVNTGYSFAQSLVIETGDSSGTLSVDALFESPVIHQSQNTTVDQGYDTTTVYADGVHTLTVMGSDGVDSWTYTGAADELTITVDQYQVDTVSGTHGVVATIGVDPTIIDGTAGGTIADVAGKDVINLGSADATINATVGADTINAGSGNLTINAASDINMVSVNQNYGTDLLTLNATGGSGYLEVFADVSGLSVINGGSGGGYIEQSGATELFSGTGSFFVADDGQDLQIIGADGEEAVDIAASNNEAGESIQIYKDFSSNATIVTDGQGGQWSLLGGQVSGSGNGSVITPPSGGNPPLPPPPPPPSQTIYDTTGVNTIDLPDENTTLYATIGTDTVVASSAAATIIASGNTNNVNVEGGSGAIDFTPGSGTNSVNTGYNAAQSLVIEAGDSGGTLTVDALFESPVVHQSQNTTIDQGYDTSTVYADGVHTLNILGTDGVDSWAYTGTSADTLTITVDAYQVDTVSDASGVLAKIGIDPTLINGIAGGNISDVAGKDIITLGSADATITASLGADTITEGTGNLTVNASQNVNQVSLGENYATNTGAVNLSLVAGYGFESVYGGSGFTNIYGGAGTVYLNQEGSTDFFAGPGEGLIVDNGSDLVVVGADGDEAIDFAPSTNETGNTILVMQNAVGATTVSDGAGSSWTLQNGQVTGGGQGVSVAAPADPYPGNDSGGTTPPAATVTISAPASESITPGGIEALTGLSVAGSGADATDQNLVMTVSDTSGLLFAVSADSASDSDVWEAYQSGASSVNPGSIAGSDVAGSGTTSLSLTGDASALAYALSNLSYAASATATTDSITVSVQDSLGHTFTKTLPVSIAAENGSGGSSGVAGTIDANIATPSFYQQSSGFLVPVVDASSMGVSSSIDINSSSAAYVGSSVNEIQVRISSQNLISDTGTTFTLVSPDGTSTVLNESDAVQDSTDLNTGNVILTTDAFYGESAIGQWTLYAKNTDGTSEGVVNGWGLGFDHEYGPAADIFTNNFAALAANDPTRTNISFTGSASTDAVDLINLSGESDIDLGGGSGEIDGVGVNIAAPVQSLNATNTSSALNVTLDSTASSVSSYSVLTGSGITNIADSSGQSLVVDTGTQGTVNLDCDNSSGSTFVYANTLVNINVNDQFSGTVDISLLVNKTINVNLDGLSMAEVQTDLKNVGIGKPTLAIRRFLCASLGKSMWAAETLILSRSLWFLRIQ